MLDLCAKFCSKQNSLALKENAKQRQKAEVTGKEEKEKAPPCTLAQVATEAGPTHLGPLSPSSCSRGVVAEIPRPWPRHAAVAAIPRLPDGYKGNPQAPLFPCQTLAATSSCLASLLAFPHTPERHQRHAIVDPAATMLPEPH